MIKFILNNLDITNYVISAEWSGSDTQTSRTLSIDVVYNTIHKFDNLAIKLGDILKMYSDKKLLYCGVVTTRDRSDSIGKMTINSNDYMHYLLRSTVSKKYTNTTAEKIAQALCGELNIKTGSLAKTNVSISKLLLENESYYNILLKAYIKASSQTGRKYIPLMDGNKLTVIEKGQASGVILDGSVNISSSSYSETTDDMINKVIIYDEKGNAVGKISNDANISKYGIYQTTYTKEKKVNAATAAKNLLTGISKTARIEMVGDIRALSGYSIKIKDKGTGLEGVFFIANDSHTFSDGVHNVSLELAFKNTMESVS